jgi:hypothetical protein
MTKSPLKIRGVRGVMSRAINIENNPLYPPYIKGGKVHDPEGSHYVKEGE